MTHPPESNDRSRTAVQLRVVAPALRRLLRAAFPRLSAEQIDDWIQHLWELVLSGKESFPETVSTSDNATAWLWRVLKNDVLDSLRRREFVALESLASGSSSGFELPDSQQWGPDSLAAERERLQRREKLLSDVLQDYVLDCESREAWIEREVMERLLRGQPREEAAKAMGISIQHLYVANHKGRHRLQELMQQQDVHQTVFASFYGKPRGRHPLPEEAVPDHQTSIVLLIRWLIEEAGAMCPSTKRLEDFQASGLAMIAADPKAFRDVRHHVDEAGCRLCQATLDLASE